MSIVTANPLCYIDINLGLFGNLVWRHVTYDSIIIITNLTDQANVTVSKWRHFLSGRFMGRGCFPIMWEMGRLTRCNKFIISLQHLPVVSTFLYNAKLNFLKTLALVSFILYFYYYLQSCLGYFRESKEAA